MKKGSTILLLALLLFGAVGLWFFWPVLSPWLGWEKKKPVAARSESPPKEKIFEDERRKLDDLVKQKLK
jgi:hypothetical protein